MTYHTDSNGVFVAGGTNNEVKNLTISNIYTNAGSTAGATDTAVSASISMPVWPVHRAVLSTFTPPAIKVALTSSLVIGSG